MSAPHPAPDAPETGIDPLVARAELRVAKLQEHSDKALEMARAVKADGSKETADSFAKISRAVRLTITLEAKLDGAVAERREQAAARAETRRAEAAADPFAPLKTGRKARVRELVREAIDREVEDPDENDLLVDALEERLLCDDAYLDIEDLPLQNVVASVCADLMLSPDWRDWKGEGWKRKPPFTRSLCSKFRRPSRRTILTDTPDPAPLE
jgi:hypothetical protein